MEETIKNHLVERKFKIVCCRSYLTTKGRCYTCPELENKEESEMDKGQEEEEEE